MAGMHFIDAKGPEGVRVYAIGDIHGRLDLLNRMHAAIADDRTQHPGKDWLVVHLGDYVDRGADSKGVIDRLIASGAADTRFVSLAGNHDIGFLDFLANPQSDGLFALYGGRETALSYGVDLVFGDPESLRRGHAALVRAMPRSHFDFLHGLKFSAEAGDFFFCHAGIRPEIPLDRQDPQDLIWIREKFLHHAGLHPKVVVHGHTPAPEPEIMANRVNVDTRAFRSGVLTALVIDGADKTIMSVKDR